MMKNNKLQLQILGVILLLVLSVIYWKFYSPHERLSTYITVISLFVLSILILFITFKIDKKNKISDKVKIIISFSFIGFNILLLLFSYFQFNYVIMPYDFHASDPFPYGYEYADLKDDVRIEYYARDYYGVEEIYRVSYDKDEIKAFLEFFKDIETRTDYQAQGSPDISLDWENDIHVMIRKMDKDDPDSGYYVMYIDLVDTSTFALKGSFDGVAVFYEVPEELKNFIIEHLLLE